MKIIKFPYFLPVMVCLLVLSAIGCTKSNIEVPQSADDNLKPEVDRSLSTRGSNNPIIHQVSLGGADFCIDIDFLGTHPGCNGNFSIVASMRADGSVSGQMTDQFGHGDGGFKATVNCLTVVGNEAWVSGIVTYGKDADGNDFAGLPIITKVKDNGKSGDQASFTYLGYSTSCNLKPNVPLFDITGQVKVR
jgi:hypothetical protein